MTVLVALLVLAATALWLSTWLRQRATVSFGTGLTRAARAFLAIAGVLIGLTIAEATLAFAWTPSDSFRFTRAGQRWYERHWKPINTLGFRDFEPDATVLRSSTGNGSAPASAQRSRDDCPSVLAVGDSFTAGHGIEDHTDTWPQILESRLQEQWDVVVLAESGWNSREQLDVLAQVVSEPTHVVIGYYWNDIESAAADAGVEPFPLPERPSGLVGSLVNRSHLLDYLYWHRLRRSRLDQAGRSYSDFIQAAYEDERVWARHESLLRETMAAVSALGAELVVVLFPDLVDPGRSHQALERVAAVFAEGGATVIPPTEVLGDLGLTDRIVSAIDPHPSVVLHDRCGALVASVIAGRAAR